MKWEIERKLKNVNMRPSIINQNERKILYSKLYKTFEIKNLLLTNSHKILLAKFMTNNKINGY